MDLKVRMVMADNRINVKLLVVLYCLGSMALGRAV